MLFIISKYLYFCATCFKNPWVWLVSIRLLSIMFILWWKEKISQAAAFVLREGGGGGERGILHL